MRLDNLEKKQAVSPKLSTPRVFKKESLQVVKAALITKEDQLIIKKALLSCLHLEGFKLIFPPQELTSKALRYQLYLHSLWYKDIGVYIPDLQIDLEGKIINVQYFQGKFELSVAFSVNTPKYWRECLLELWP